MKKGIWLSMLVLVTLLQACKPDELVRVEQVVGEYDYTRDCEVYDLVTQGAPSTSSETAILYVVRPLDDENGYISLLDDEVFLESDLSFKKSIVNYSLEGEFDGAGGLVITTDVVDLDANTRTICHYACTKR